MLSKLAILFRNIWETVHTHVDLEAIDAFVVELHDLVQRIERLEAIAAQQLGGDEHQDQAPAAKTKAQK